MVTDSPDKFVGTWYDSKDDTIIISKKDSDEYAVQIKHHIYKFNRPSGFNDPDVTIHHGAGIGHLQGNSITFSKIQVGKINTGEKLFLRATVQCVSGTKEHFTIKCQDIDEYSNGYSQIQTAKSSELNKL